jgi:hypothetical protein
MVRPVDPSICDFFQALNQEDMGIELIGEGNTSEVGGRGVRLREREARAIVREQKLGYHPACNEVKRFVRL